MGPAKKESEESGIRRGWPLKQKKTKPTGPPAATMMPTIVLRSTGLQPLALKVPPGRGRITPALGLAPAPSHQGIQRGKIQARRHSHRAYSQTLSLLFANFFSGLARQRGFINNDPFVLTKQEATRSAALQIRLRLIGSVVSRFLLQLLTSRALKHAAVATPFTDKKRASCRRQVRGRG